MPRPANNAVFFPYIEFKFIFFRKKCLFLVFGLKKKYVLFEDLVVTVNKSRMPKKVIVLICIRTFIFVYVEDRYTYARQGN